MGEAFSWLSWILVNDSLLVVGAVRFLSQKSCNGALSCEIPSYERTTCLRWSHKAFCCSAGATEFKSSVALPISIHSIYSEQKVTITHWTHRVFVVAVQANERLTVGTTVTDHDFVIISLLKVVTHTVQSLVLRLWVCLVARTLQLLLLWWESSQCRPC